MCPFSINDEKLALELHRRHDILRAHIDGMTSWCRTAAEQCDDTEVAALFRDHADATAEHVYDSLIAVLHDHDPMAKLREYLEDGELFEKDRRELTA